MAEHRDLLELVSRLPLFAGVPPADIEALIASSRRRRYPRGQVVFSTGDPGDTLLVVVSGRMKATARSADGGELILAVVDPGGVIGELSVADGGTRSADCITLDATEVLLVPGEVISDLKRRFPAVTANLLAAVASSFRRLTEATADLVFLDLPRRVGKALLDHPHATKGVVDLGLSQEQFSHQVAGTRQSVNQALRGFERRGWIEINGRQIVLRDPGALARFSGDELSGG